MAAEAETEEKYVLINNKNLFCNLPLPVGWKYRQIFLKKQFQQLKFVDTIYCRSLYIMILRGFVEINCKNWHTIFLKTHFFYKQNCNYKKNKSEHKNVNACKILKHLIQKFILVMLNCHGLTRITVKTLNYFWLK